MRGIIRKEKVISYEYNYRFFPRSELYTICSDPANFETDAASQATTARAYYEHRRSCWVIGTAYQYPSIDYIFGFDMFEPELQTDRLDVLFDSGKIEFISESPEAPPTSFFDTCAFKYKDADFFNRQLTIQNNADQKGLVLGYLYAVYITPSKKYKFEFIPIDSSTVTVNTRDGNYFLKEFCIFSAYKRDAYLLQDEVSYQVKADDNELCSFTIRRPENSDT